MQRCLAGGSHHPRTGHAMGVCAALGMTPIRTQFDPEVRANCTHAACTPHAARPHPDVIGPNKRDPTHPAELPVLLRHSPGNGRTALIDANAVLVVLLEHDGDKGSCRRPRYRSSARP